MPTFRNTLFHLPMKMEQTECSETSAFKIQTPGNYAKESIQHIEHGESLKSRIVVYCLESDKETCLCWPPLEFRQVANLQKLLDTMKIELCTNACVNGQFRL
jgi:hypothetical protein